MKPEDTRSRAVRSSFVVLVVIAAGILAIRGCASSSTRRPAAGYGQFAGYVSFERVTEISASWTVPQVLGGTGIAGTWIGAEAAGNPGPFIQIGTNEQRPASSRQAEYLSFWSDTQHRFKPMRLFGVNAGDHITARLRRTPAGWDLALIDASTSMRRRFDTTDEAHASFNDAQWIQEDVTDGRTTDEYAYPTLTPLTMTNVRLDSHALDYADAESSWMSFEGKALAPSPLRDEAFTVSPTRIGAAGARYLQIIKPADEVLAGLGEQAETWSRTTPPARVSAAIAKLRQTLRGTNTRLARGDWSPAVADLIRRLIANENAQLAKLEAQHGQATTTTWRHIIQSSRSGRIGLKIRRALHAPELVR